MTFPTLTGRGPIDTYAKTANFTLLDSHNGTCHTNDGATGVVTFALPPAVVGMTYMFSVEAAQALRVDPNGNETISLPSTGVPGAAGKYLTNSTIGGTLRVACFKTGSWRVLGYTGTWTSEA